MTSTRTSTSEENNEENNTNEDLTTQENANKDVSQQVDQEKLDNLLLNLRTIAEIKEFDKLRVINDNLQIDQSQFPFITRWYYAEGRDSTSTKISDTLDETFGYIETIKNNIYDNANRDIQRILVGLTTSVRGLERLKVTYKKDINIITRLDLYLEKINIKINELNLTINIINT